MEVISDGRRLKAHGDIAEGQEYDLASTLPIAFPVRRLMGYCRSSVGSRQVQRMICCIAGPTGWPRHLDDDTCAGMHDHLWLGVDLKLREAHVSLDEMERSLQPPERTHINVVLESAGAIVDTRWQDKFYGHVATFLAKVRSVPEVIESCFGADCGSRTMKDWFKALDPAEQERRQTFSDEFRADHQAFGKHNLSVERNVSEHRLGFASIEGRVIGPFGNVHIATPSRRIPAAESRPLEGDIGDDPAKQWAASLPPRPIQPRWDQFTIGGKPLFAECSAYLALAQQLVDKARCISQQVHGTDVLTSPPAS